jgi:hypothetical protein
LRERASLLKNLLNRRLLPHPNPLPVEREIIALKGEASD